MRNVFSIFSIIAAYNNMLNVCLEIERPVAFVYQITKLEVALNLQQTPFSKAVSFCG